MELDLNDRVALVTASSGGIGLHIAIALAKEGAVVVVNGRSGNSVENACDEIRKSCPSANILPLVADLSVLEGFETAVSTHPHVDILVNNLGIYEAVDFFETTDEQWRHLFEVNVISGVRLSRHYLKTMLDQNWGRMVFISSESAINPAPEMAHYSATKTTQLSISRGLAELTKGTSVTVNAVLPGSTKTDSVAKFIQEVFPDEEYENAERRFMQENRPTSLIQRLIQPSEIAALVAFVCSPQASAINGAALRVDGGIVRSVF
ncbi:SDR family NAD(P)-dependent oxidoreductase [Nitrosomonas sp.]|uniref:SDR family NAD(P)-dependent oxidoreductase n=1 Tax=Nitrosomonas sp. TaxID=42353 RepID=UPI00208799FC|nr:SDR family oxidoreductase [Nitrosomonas sp.]GJL75747.1 MAG: 3-oxoacyl-ACP reductase [Nitrosomonas sp.]